MFALFMVSAANEATDAKLEQKDCANLPHVSDGQWSLDLYGCRYKNARNLYALAVKEFKRDFGPYQASMQAYKIASESYTDAAKGDFELPTYRRRLTGSEDINDLILAKLQNDDTLGVFETEFHERRERYLKSAKTLQLTTSPYKAARDAYVKATKIYTQIIHQQNQKQLNHHQNQGKADRRLSTDESSHIQSGEISYLRNFNLRSEDVNHLNILQDSYWKTGSSESKFHTVENIRVFLEDHRM